MKTEHVETLKEKLDELINEFNGVLHHLELGDFKVKSIHLAHKSELSEAFHPDSCTVDPDTGAVNCGSPGELLGSDVDPENPVIG